jgi:hypothetical protein
VSTVIVVPEAEVDAVWPRETVGGFGDVGVAVGSVTAGFVYVTFRDAVAVLPVASAATAVIVFSPSLSESFADHFPSDPTVTEVPLTFSDETPLLSDAVPETVMSGLDTFAPSSGEVIATEGRPASPPPPKRAPAWPPGCHPSCRRA